MNGDAQRERGDERADIGLEEVSAHTGDVTNVVTDVIGDDSGVAGVVLGDTGFDLADEVGADVGSLGVYAAADTGEQRDGRCAEGEAEEDVVVAGDYVDKAASEQAETDNAHAHDGAAGERDAERLVHAAGESGVGGADVRLGGDAHSEKARKYREACSDDEADGGAEVYEYSDQHKQNYDKYRKYFIFGAKEGTCAFGNSGCDLLHPAVSRIALADIARLIKCEEKCNRREERSQPYHLVHFEFSPV